MKEQYVYLETFREGYSPDQCRKTMTVQELADFLQELAEEYGDQPIYMSNDNGYTYGAITEGRFRDYDGEELDY